MPFPGTVLASEPSTLFLSIVSTFGLAEIIILIDQSAQYPYRCVQIVLRLYSSPSEILTGFDVDAPCCAFDGTRVWANPRSVVSMMRQANTVDITRRSPSYEVRLSKYSFRDFEIYVPNLKREEIDPTVNYPHHPSASSLTLQSDLRTFDRSCRGACPTHRLGASL